MLNKFGEVIENASLEHYNTYGIKTNSKYLVKVDSIENLILLLKYIDNNNLKYYVLGKGSNVILPDVSFNGIIISLEKLNSLEIKDNIVSAESGIILSVLANKVIQNNLSGFEYLAGIPGTLGGALYGNAGVKNHEIYDNLEYIEVVRNKKLIKLNKDDIKFSYRYTEFKNNNDIIVKATFILNNGNKDEMLDIVKENRLKRLNNQPLEFKNAGSVFKNPENEYAGKLIENVGLKGYSVGDACVSNKHANFIINKGNATSRDIKDLIKYVQDKVYEKYNIKLELEQIIVDWN